MSRPRMIGAATFALIVLALLAQSRASAVSAPFLTSRLGTGAGVVRVSGRRFVWDYSRGLGEGNVAMYDMDTGLASDLTTRFGTESSPDISDDTVVWLQDGKEVWAETLSGGAPRRVSPAGVWAYGPRISWPYVVWSESGAHGDRIGYCDLRSGETSVVPFDEGTALKPDVSSGRIVFTSPAGVVLYEIGGGFRDLGSPGGDDPAIDGDRVAWVAGSAGSTRIVTRSIAPGSLPETLSPPQYPAMQPAVSGDDVAWTGQGSIWLKSVGGGAALPIAHPDSWWAIPDIDGRLIAWNGLFAGDPAEVTIGDLTKSYWRIAGTDRYETAVEAAKPWPSFPDAIVCTGRNWPDALVASSLAGLRGCPILLTERDRLPAATQRWLWDVPVSPDIFVLGGRDAISDAVVAAIAASAGGTVERIAGCDRYETAQLVARRVMTSPGWIGRYRGTVFIATGLDFPDAMSAGPLAYRCTGPLFLVGRSGITTPTREAMGRPQRIVILGSEDAVSKDTEAHLVAAFPNAEVVRLGGVDRFDTSVKVAEWGVGNLGMSWQASALATGKKFPDALVAGPVQGRLGGPLLLTWPNRLPDEVDGKLFEKKADIQQLRVFGGANVVGGDVMGRAALRLE